MGIDTYYSLQEAIKGYFGENVTIEKAMHMSGGDINSARMLHLSNGEKVFLKMNNISNSAFFDAEEEGIDAIAATKAIGTPKLYAKGIDKKEGISFLMMEVIERGPAHADTWLKMGHEYADMHLAETDEFICGPENQYGFYHDNFIGATRQINTPKKSWIDFFRECRLEPQFKMAEWSLDANQIKKAVKLLDRLDNILIEPDRPSLLHGDMWGGNHLVDKNGKVVLIDPAVYVGHSEADIAMTEMFGRMPEDFYRGYYEKIPKKDGYKDRREIYNLYHYLNHFNLFGGYYLMSVLNTVNKYSA